VLSEKIISKEMCEKFFAPHSDDGDMGLGVYRWEEDGKVNLYYTVGGDFGVDFFSAYLPQNEMIVSALGNTEVNTFPLLKEIVKAFA